MPKKHLILIGMPGCGKSSVGARLAAALGAPFVDADLAFAAHYGISPADCITAEGEAAFRQKESDLLGTLLASKEPQVLACGGGIVERAENIDAMRERGLVLFLERPLCDLATEGRPLSARHGVDALWARRQPLYARAAHRTVAAKESVEATAQAILECLKGESLYE
jgi:shikimate dehydrogenase